MTFQQVMKKLKSYGTAQNRKIYKRHGAGEKLYGVSFANLNKLAKEIKLDQTLASKLWLSGNYDARSLATKVAEPSKFTIKTAQAWVKEVDNYMHAGLLGGLLAKAPAAHQVLSKWTKSKQEYVRQAGYSLLGAMLKNNAGNLSSAEAKKYLKTIEKDIHTSANWARYGMNWALIALGVYKDNIAQEALAAAKRIGQVKVDHGATSCQTPEATAYIKKTRAYHKLKQK